MAISAFGTLDRSRCSRCGEIALFDGPARRHAALFRRNNRFNAPYAAQSGQRARSADPARPAMPPKARPQLFTFITLLRRRCGPLPLFGCGHRRGDQGQEAADDARDARSASSSSLCAFYGSGLEAFLLSLGLLVARRAIVFWLRKPCDQPGAGGCVQPRLGNQPPELLREAPQANLARAERPGVIGSAICMPSWTRVISSVSSALTRRLIRQLR